MKIGLVISVFGCLLLDRRGNFWGIGLELFDISYVLSLLVNVEVLLGDILGNFLFFEGAFALAPWGFSSCIRVCKLVIFLRFIVKDDCYLGLGLLDRLLWLFHFCLWLIGLSLSISKTQIDFWFFLLVTCGDFRLDVILGLWFWLKSEGLFLDSQSFGLELLDGFWLFFLFYRRGHITWILTSAVL